MTLHIEQRLRRRVSTALFLVAVALWIGLGTYLYQAQQQYTEEAAKERTFRAVFETSEAPLILADEDGHVVDWNPAAEDLLGWTEEEVTGRHLAFLFRLRPADEATQQELDFWRRRLLRRDLGDKVLQLDCPVRRKTGPPLAAVVEIWQVELDEPPLPGHGTIFFALKIIPKEQLVRVDFSDSTAQKESP